MILCFSFPDPVLCQCSSSGYNRASDYYRRKEYRSAKTLLVPLTECGGQLGADAQRLLSMIENEESCQPIRNSANMAILRGNLQEACNFISQMEQICPNLLGSIKAQAGGCKNDPEIQQAKNEKALEEASALENEKKYAEALSILQQIKDSDPSFAGIDAAIQRVNRKASRDRDHQTAATTPKKIPENLKAMQITQEHNTSSDNNINSVRYDNTCPYDYYMSQAQDQNIRNNYYRAREWTQKALLCRNGNPAAQESQTAIEQAIDSEKAALNSALGAFYGGKYEESHNMLHDLSASGKASPQARRLAEYYLAASSISAYLVAGESKPELQTDGIRHYKTYRSMPSDAPIPQAGLSPRLLQILEKSANLDQPNK